MITFIYSNDIAWINMQIDKKNKLLKNEKITPIVMNGKDLGFSFDDFMIEVSTIPFFEGKKVIILNNLEGFNTKKVLDESNYLELEKLLKNPPKDVDVIFTLNGNKPDGKRKLTKLFKKYTDYIIQENTQQSDVQSFISAMLQKAKIEIDQDAVKLLRNFCASQTDVLSAFEKLTLLDRQVSKEDITKLIVDNRQAVIYELSEALIKKDKQKVFNSYKTLVEQNYQPIHLLYHIASKYRQYYQLFTLNDRNISVLDISRKLKMSEKQVYYLLNNHRNLITPKTCLTRLSELANLDQRAKSGKIDYKLGLELFMIKVLT